MIANPSVQQGRSVGQSRSLISTFRLIAVALTLLCLPVRADKQDDAPAAATEKKSDKKSDKKEMILKYDDGKADGKRSIAGTGEIIEFELPGDDYKLKAVKLHCSRYGTPNPPKEDVEFSIVDADDSTTVLHTEQVPYATFKRGESRWTMVPFKKPVTVPKKFWVIVEFNAEQTKGVYLSFDTSTGGAHSKTGVAGGDSAPVTIGGDWMIQAIVVKE